MSLSTVPETGRGRGSLSKRSALVGSGECVSNATGSANATFVSGSDAASNEIGIANETFGSANATFGSENGISSSANEIELVSSEKGSESARTNETCVEIVLSNGEERGYGSAFESR